MALFPAVAASPRNSGSIISNGGIEFYGFGCAESGQDLENFGGNGVGAAMTASLLRVSAQNVGDDNATLTLFVDGSAPGSGPVVTITAGTSGVFKDSSNTASLSDGDYIALEMDHDAAMHGESVAWQTVQLMLEPSGAASWMLAGGPANTNAPRTVPASTTNYAAIYGPLDGTTESTSGYEALRAMTLEDLKIEILSFGGTNSVCDFRIDEVSATLTVTYTGTGQFEDNTNSDDVDIGEVINTRIDNAGGSATNWGGPSLTGFGAVAVIGGYDNSIDDVLTFLPFGGWNTDFLTPEGDMEIEAEESVTLRGLQLNVFTYNQDRTIISRVNGSDGNLTVSFTGSGIISDTTNSDSLDAGDTCAIRQNNGSGALNGYSFFVEWDTSAPAARRPERVQPVVARRAVAGRW